MLAERLPFRLPEFAPRVIWSSAHAREVWSERISRVSNAWLTVERDSVAAGIRPSALQHISPEQLPELIRVEAARGSIVLPLSQVPRVEGYQSATTTLQAGAPFDYRCAITRPEYAAQWGDARDDEATGRLLGTPECCRRFFDRVWTAGRWMDTTWPMHATAPHVAKAGELNMLWRWLGVRPVSHLPCSPTCVESLTLADKCWQLLPEPERSWHREILSLPVLWTSLHGIADIVSPIHRMVVPTDATAERLEIRFEGDVYPDEGASGLSFPFRRRLSNAAPLRLVWAQQPADNGFSTREAQDAAHARLLEALGDRTWGTVVDLGCGDGTLLSKIAAKRRVGLEINPARAAKARLRLDYVGTGDCTAPIVNALLKKERPDLVIAQRDRNSLQRLRDMGHSGAVLAYSYEFGEPGPDLVHPASEC
jgi:hypothetical protein